MSACKKTDKLNCTYYHDGCHYGGPCKFKNKEKQTKLSSICPVINATCMRDECVAYRLKDIGYGKTTIKPYCAYLQVQLEEPKET